MFTEILGEKVKDHRISKPKGRRQAGNGERVRKSKGEWERMNNFGREK